MSTKCTLYKEISILRNSRDTEQDSVAAVDASAVLETNSWTNQDEEVKPPNCESATQAILMTPTSEYEPLNLLPKNDQTTSDWVA